MAPAPRLLLASASPRRRELLALLGRAWDVVAVDVDEQPLAGEGAADLVERLAVAKARAGLDRDPDAVVIGADTVVELDGEVLGKPLHRADAAVMLRRLSGRTHRVLTGMGGAARDHELHEVIATEVTFAELDDEAVEAYVATGEPDDKAGAYGIQGLGGAFVTSLHGSYHNVVGLPVAQLAALLERLERLSGDA